MSVAQGHSHTLENRPAYLVKPALLILCISNTISMNLHVYYEIHDQKQSLPNLHANTSVNLFVFVCCFFSFWHIKFSKLRNHDNIELCSWLVVRALEGTECYRLWITPHWFVWEGLLCILCNFPGRFIVMTYQKESVYFPLFHKASRYISMLYTDVFIYVMNVYIDMRLQLIFMYSKNSAECKASICSWLIEFTCDVQVYQTVRL